MKRVHIWLEDKQIKRLRDHYEQSGSRQSETIRRAVDLFFREQKRYKKYEQSNNGSQS